MRSKGNFFFPLAASAALIVTAGCGGPSSVAPALPTQTDGTQAISRSGALIDDPTIQAATQALLRPRGLNTAVDALPDFADPDAAAKTSLIVTDENNNIVYGLTSAGAITARLTSGMNSPQGVALDAAGDLFIANSGASQLLEYKSDYKTRLAVIPTPGTPFAVDVDKATGMLAETNITGPNFTNGSVSLYPKGATKPCVTLGSSNLLFNVAYASFDAHGNLYINGITIKGTNEVVFIGVVTGGCAAKAITPLTTSNVFVQAGGLRVRADGDITMSDASNGKLYTYKPKLKGSLGSPVATTTLAGNSIAAGYVFGASGSIVYDLAPVAGLVFEHHYPSGSELTSFRLPNTGADWDHGGAERALVDCASRSLSRLGFAGCGAGSRATPLAARMDSSRMDSSRLDSSRLSLDEPRSTNPARQILV